MASRGQPSRSNQASIKYRWVPLKVSSFDLSDGGQEVDASGADPHKQGSKESEPKYSEIVSTAEFVSAVGGLWNCANQSLSVLQPKAHDQHNEEINLKGNVLWCSDGEIYNKETAGDRGYSDVDLTSAACSSNLVNSNFELISVAQKILAFEACSGDESYSFWRYLQLDNSYKHGGSSNVNKLACMRVPIDLRNIYSWISESPFFGLKDLVTSSQNDFKKPGETCISESKRAPLDNLAMKSIVSNSNVTTCQDPLPHKTVEVVENVGGSCTSLYSEYFPTPVMDLEATGAVSRTPSSILCSDYHIDNLVLSGTSSEEYKHMPDNESIPEGSKSQHKELHLKDEPTPESCSLAKDKPNLPIAKQKHAFAGALAGTFVSLCLHPVDTIKTVIQSHNMSQKPVFDVVGSIISERGASGLYRGIASNIASSAPISAVYTFTYESVKAAMLPLLPQEYHSLAHCTAGGCASIATSFIFTPSERIKQQMQVSSQYRNCWTALVGILNKGGFSSLYAGWGAVLCRNIPHSVIKFYTYESLKKLSLSSTESNAHPSTFQTLVCGGLAGSTAALFTTPFDVVKTRLQTQIPGSLRRYDSVLHALTEIGRHEGLKGLYRGLTPRLIMYVTQGAIFFSSYEFFKSVFCLEVPQRFAHTIQNKKKEEDESNPSLVPSSASASSSSSSSSNIIIQAA